MIGITLAATLGFVFGAAFKAGWVVVHGPVAAASSALTYVVVMQVV